MLDNKQAKLAVLYGFVCYLKYMKFEWKPDLVKQKYRQ